MRYRLRTLLLLITGSVAPIYAGCEGWKVGCLVQVLMVWAGLVTAPQVLMGSFFRWMTTENGRVRLITGFGAIANFGYLCSILLSMINIGFRQPWQLS